MWTVVVNSTCPRGYMMFSQYHGMFMKVQCSFVCYTLQIEFTSSEINFFLTLKSPHIQNLIHGICPVICPAFCDSSNPQCQLFIIHRGRQLVYHFLFSSSRVTCFPARLVLRYKITALKGTDNEAVVYIDHMGGSSTVIRICKRGTVFILRTLQKWFSGQLSSNMCVHLKQTSTKKKKK